jgi:hypothetical protein
MRSNLSTVQSILASPRLGAHRESPFVGRLVACGQPLRQSLRRSACSLVMPWFTEVEKHGTGANELERS